MEIIFSGGVYVGESNHRSVHKRAKGPQACPSCDAASRSQTKGPVKRSRLRAFSQNTFDKATAALPVALYSAAKCGKNSCGSAPDRRTGICATGQEGKRMSQICVTFRSKSRRRRMGAGVLVSRRGLPAQVLRGRCRGRGCGYCVRAPAEPETPSGSCRRTRRRIAFRRLVAAARTGRGRRRSHDLFDSAATTQQKPESVYAARAARCAPAPSVGRGGHAAADAAARGRHACRTEEQRSCSTPCRSRSFSP